MFLFGIQVFLFGLKLFLLGTKLFLFGTELFLFGLKLFLLGTKLFLFGMQLFLFGIYLPVKKALAQVVGFQKEGSSDLFPAAGMGVYPGGARELADVIVDYLKKKENKALRNLAAVPMLLQIMAIMWENQQFLDPEIVK